MAAQVKLVRSRDFVGDISSLSLYDNEEGYSLAWDGWEPTIAADDDLRVAEVLTLQVTGSDHDDLADKLKALDDKIQEVGWYKNGSECYGIWLRTQLLNETYARQVLITKASGELGSPMFNPPVSPGSYLGQYQLALERMPYWEPTIHKVYGAVGVDCLGGTYDYTTYGGSPGAVAGNEPARIAYLIFRGVNGGGGPLYEFWLGFRTDRFGERANFVPTWECEDGTLTNSTSEVADATASGGSKVQCTFGDESMLPRVTVKVEDVTTDYTDQRGIFNILLRAKLTAAGTCRVRLLDGLSSADSWRTQSRVTISSESWKLYELGTVVIPSARGRYTSSFMRKCALRIEAERTSGSGNLELDCSVPIPSAEGALHVEGGAVHYVLGDRRPIYVLTHPAGEMDAWSYSGGFPVKSVTCNPENYGLPTGAGLLVLAGQRETEHVLDECATLSMQIYNHYRTLQGSG